MSLAQAFAAGLVTTDDRCPVADLLASLPTDDATALRRVLEPRAMDRGTIRRILAANGYTVTEEAIGRHKSAVARARGVATKTLPCGCTGL